MAINIAYACNEAYMEQTTVSMVSLFENCSLPDKLHIFFVDMGTDESSKENLKELVKKYGASITIIPFDDIAYDLNISERTGRHIKSVYAKIFFGRIDSIDRIIYLDSDMVITDDINDLWNIDLDEDVIAGVETIHTIEDNAKIGYSPEDRAINDGMVLMNLKKWREDQLLEKCLDFINKYNGEPPVLSEGTVNAVCKGSIKIIHPRYNLMSAIVGESAKKIETLTGRKYYTQRELDDATSNPCIIHFLSGFYNRPWCSKCTHPLKKEYFIYRAKTKWANAELKKSKLPIRQRIVGLAYNHLPISLFVQLRRLK